ncbi:MAG: radical SAM family heme chaperone HemW [Lachnospiraceae bacterium]|nr:radical SAM family heme chaperone HemW [Lachnospiraceae bacterium]
MIIKKMDEMFMREMSIYIHIPFCIKKCNYCDFLSGKASEDEKEQYINAVCKEIDLIEETWYIRSIFFGGGTPSVVSPSLINKILCKLKEKFIFLDCIEISIEVNPGTVDFGKLKEYLCIGINRLSIGMQSTNDEELKILGRIHTYQDFLTTFQAAREAGFRNINIDIMSSLPGQTLTSYQKTLERVISLAPEHISSYSLIIEEGTPFYQQKHSLNLPSEDTEIEIDERTEYYLTEHGYEKYEISNYAKEGYQCRHNKIYWTRGEYYGFGIGAASLLEDQEKGNRRVANTDNIKQYLLELQKKNPELDNIQKITQLSKEDRMEEFMFLGLRLIKGIESREFERSFGVSLIDVYGNKLCKLENEKLIKKEDVFGNSIYSLTRRGMQVSNVVLSEFLLP